MMPLEPRLDFAVLGNRLQRLVRLDTTVFDEVKEDPTATTPALLIVFASTFLAGIGGALWWAIQDYGDKSQVVFQSAIIGSVVSVGLWIVWTGVVWVILTQLFREEADWWQLLRTMGMASAPLALSVAMFVPAIELGVALASVALFFGLTTIAVQAVTPANPARVLVANLAGFAVWAIILGLFVNRDSYLAPGIFLFDAPADALKDFIGAGVGIDIGDIFQ